MLLIQRLKIILRLNVRDSMIVLFLVSEAQVSIKRIFPPVLSEHLGNIELQKRLRNLEINVILLRLVIVIGLSLLSSSSQKIV
jgi:hypothetical protein